VASVAGLISPPAMAAYNVSKAAVVSLSETLSAELARNNVGVTVVCPAFFATNLLHAGRFGEPRHAEFVEASMRRSPITAEQVAQATLDAVARRQLHVVLPLRGKMWWWVKRVMPALVARFLGNAYRRDLPDGVG
jgi:short-subunit dehydrogenase